MKCCKHCFSTENKNYKWYTGPTCRSCYIKEYNSKNRTKILLNLKKYREENKEKVKEQKENWTKNNTDKVKEQKALWFSNNKDRVKLKTEEYRKTHHQQINDYARNRKRERYYSDVNYRLVQVLRARLSCAIKKNSKAGSAVTDLGCSIANLKKHLQSKFKEGMTWNNWTTDGWHIDHIRPLSSFDLSNANELKKACHYSNLQPLWAKDNLSKGCKRD